MKKDIKVKDLSLWYGKKQALYNINTSFENKQVTALIGPSGCGKSTFLRCINRMNDLIDSVNIKGEIKIGDQNIYDKNIDLTELRSEVGMVFQKPNVFPMSIYENIAYGPKMQGLKDKKKLDEIVIKSLKRAAIYDEVKNDLNKSALDLSGGQQQRICIARTIAMDPKIILMDEPTSALDPASTLKIEELIRELKNNYTIIIVTHNMQQASRIADQTIFFLNGKLIEADKTDKIFSNPKDERTENYITGRFG